MPQRPKVEVRESILAAAVEAFAEVGFEGATLSDVARRAGSSVGNLYKYFSNKEELFEAALPRSFVADFEQRIQLQVEALSGEPDVFALGAAHPYRQRSQALLRFAFENRARVVFLLSRAQGTQYSAFAGGLEQLLVKLAVKHAEATYPAFRVAAPKRRSLSRIYRGFLSSLANILDVERSQSAVVEATRLFTTYHLSGLDAFFRSGFSDEVSKHGVTDEREAQ